MARIRSVKPEFWSSEQVMECSPMARLLFIGVWNFCDDAGNHVNSERTIKAQVFPGDDITSADVRRLLDELSTNDLIAFYVHDGKEYLHVTGWKKHQRIDRPTYKHPPYPGGGSAPSRRTLDELSTPERSGEEGSGEEEDQSSLRSDSQSPDEPGDLLGEAPRANNVRQHPADRVTSAVLAAYHDLLPKCQAVAVMNPKRRKRIQAADKLARQVCRDQGWEYDPESFWRAYFAECAKDPWMRGEVPNPKNDTWKQNIDVLIAEDRFAKVMDSAVTNLERAA